jgi:SOS-response transcriptional repressor LexA
MKQITERNKEAYDFIVSFTVEHGYSPTQEEIGEHMGVTLWSGRRHLIALHEAGWIKYEPSMHRKIEVLKSDVCLHCGRKKRNKA